MRLGARTAMGFGGDIELVETFFFFYPSYFILQILENFRNCVFYVRDSFSSILGRIFEDPKEEIRSRKSKMNKLGICDKKKLYTES